MGWQMPFNGLFSLARGARPVQPLPQAEGRLDFDRAMYAAGLMANLINRAAATNNFRGAIPAHPHLTQTRATREGDEGSRPDYGLTAHATATHARVTLSGTDAGRLGFLSFAPLHRQENGCDPEWGFDSPDATMTARCTIIGVSFDAACLDNPDGSATISLVLSD